MTTTSTGYGTTTTDGGPSRGIYRQGDTFTAFCHAAFVRDFKTLKGAIRYMERMGYDAHGRRI